MARKYRDITIGSRIFQLKLDYDKDLFEINLGDIPDDNPGSRRPGITNHVVRGESAREVIDKATRLAIEADTREYTPCLVWSAYGDDWDPSIIWFDTSFDPETDTRLYARKSMRTEDGTWVPHGPAYVYQREPGHTVPFTPERYQRCKEASTLLRNINEIQREAATRMRAATGASPKDRLSSSYKNNFNPNPDALDAFDPRQIIIEVLEERLAELKKD